MIKAWAVYFIYLLFPTDATSSLAFPVLFLTVIVIITCIPAGSSPRPLPSFDFHQGVKLAWML